MPPSLSRASRCRPSDECRRVRTARASWVRRLPAGPGHDAIVVPIPVAAVHSASVHGTGWITVHPTVTNGNVPGNARSAQLRGERNHEYTRVEAKTASK